MAEEDAKMIEKYKNGIKEIDRVTEEIYESRLAVCKECELLNAGTCGACRMLCGTSGCCKSR